MSKQELILEAVKIAKEVKSGYICFYDDVFYQFFGDKLDEELYKDFDLWYDFKDYFQEFTNVVNADILGDGYDSWDFGDENIYRYLAKFPKLKTILFRGVNIDGTMEYFEEGLKKIPNLETIWLAGTQLKELPKGLLDSKLKLGLLGNKFYKQNFHFKLKENHDIDIYTRISELGQLKLEKYFNPETITQFKNEEFREIAFSEQKKYAFEQNNWGLVNSDKTILILKDDYVKSEFGASISIYILNNNKHDKYEIFKTYNDLFIELNTKEDCFEIDKNGNLEMFFCFKEDYSSHDKINYTTLKQEYLSQNTDYRELSSKKYQVNQLLDYIGGENLIASLRNQNKDKQIELTEIFSKNKYIEQIEIDNFKIFEDKHIVQLSETNILIGKNSTGKTSFLQAVAFGLSPEKTNQINEQYWAYSNYINQKVINSKPEDYHFSKITLNWKIDAKDRKEISKLLKEKQKNINFTAREQNIYSKHLSADKDLPQTFLLLAYGENLFPDREESTKTSNSFVSRLITGNYKTNHIEALFSDYYNNLINPLHVLNKLQENELPKGISEKQKRELKTIKDLFFKKIGGFLKIGNANLFEIKLLDNKQYKFVDKSGNLFDLYQLSEGYRTNISLLADILVKIFASRNNLFLKSYEYSEFDKILDEVKGTILIDEFDKHLHPVWQKSFIGLLRELLPNIQFIFSTHNVVALQSAEGQTALKVSTDEEGKIKIEREIIKKGDSVETLLNKFFDFDSQFMGNETQEKYNNFKELSRQIIDEEIEINEEFKTQTRELLGLVENQIDENTSEELKSRVSTQLAQIRYITGENIEL